MRVGSLPLLLLTFLLLPQQGRALQDPPPPPPPVTVEIQVVDFLSRTPLAQVELRVRELGLQAFTNEEGKLTIPEVPVGAYFFEFQKEGYEGVAGVVQLQQSGEILVELLPEGLQAPEVAPAAGTGGGPSVLAGRVVDATSDRPLEGVQVNLPGVARSTVTDEAGRFSFPSLEPGAHAMEVSRIGYGTRWESTEVLPDKRVEVLLSLSTEPIELDPIEVSVESQIERLELAGFYNRRMMGFGQFMAQEEIEATPAGETSDLFNSFSGIRYVASGSQPSTYFISLTRPQAPSFIARTQGNCFPAVWIDDIQISQGGEEPARLNWRLTPEQVAGIEVYEGAGQVPSRYTGTGRACGVILIWTRG
jgi:hypothetical protein